MPTTGPPLHIHMLPCIRAERSAQNSLPLSPSLPLPLPSHAVLLGEVRLAAPDLALHQVVEAQSCGGFRKGSVPAGWPLRLQKEASGRPKATNTKQVRERVQSPLRAKCEERVQEARDPATNEGLLRLLVTKSAPCAQAPKLLSNPSMSSSTLLTQRLPEPLACGGSLWI